MLVTKCMLLYVYISNKKVYHHCFPTFGNVDINMATTQTDNVYLGVVVAAAAFGVAGTELEGSHHHRTSEPQASLVEPC